jgi:ornithine cyclodeaminase/alanine dehydrogenase-like protein (mu-crystallin family)
VGIRLRVLGWADIDRAVNMVEAIGVMAATFAQLGSGDARVPQRLGVETDSGLLLAMPGFLPQQRALAIKVVSVFPGNSSLGLPSVYGLVLVLDASTGAPLALIEGSHLTALRTGATSGLAMKLMARKNARIVALFGAGVQARTQLAAARAVRHITEVRVLARTPESAARLVAELSDVDARVFEDASAAVRGADIVITATTSMTPLVHGRDLAHGTHVTAIGAYTGTMREVDADTVRRARVVVDTRQGALAEAGDLLIPIRDGIIGAEHIVAELSELATGAVAGRTSDQEITLFKSVGHAAQDVALARHVLDVAEAQGLGTLVSL